MAFGIYFKYGDVGNVPNVNIWMEWNVCICVWERDEWGKAEADQAEPADMGEELERDICILFFIIHLFLSHLITY